MANDNQRAAQSNSRIQYKQKLLSELSLTQYDANYLIVQKQGGIVTTVDSTAGGQRATVTKNNTPEQQYLNNNPDFGKMYNIIIANLGLLNAYSVDGNRFRSSYNNYLNVNATNAQKGYDLQPFYNFIIAPVAALTPDPVPPANTVAPVNRSQPTFKQLTNVYPDTFSNFDNPTAPNVYIQFRNSFNLNGSNLKDPDINNPMWTDITAMKDSNGNLNYQNKFFVSMDLEDTAGIKKLTLTLIDKFYTTLENIVQQSIFSTIFTSKLTTETTTTMTPPNSEDALLLSFNSSNFINLRLKYGYEERRGINYADFNYRTTTDGDKPVKSTPWIYFQIMNVKQSLSETGLTFTISALSTISNVLSQARVVQQFAKIQNPPLKIIDFFRANLAKLSSKVGGNIRIADWSESGTEKPAHITDIEISLGGEPQYDPKTKKQVQQFMSLGEIFDSICAKVLPLRVNADGTTESTIENQQNPPDSRLVPYGYTIAEDVPNPQNSNLKETVISFKYQNPDSFWSNNSVKIRNYYWREYPKTVVKSLDITSNMDFAQMNMPIFEVTGEGSKRTVMISGAPFGGISATLTDIDFVKMIEKGVPDGSFSFTGAGEITIPQNSDDATKVYSAIKAKFLNNINNSVFNGTIELNGDPFFFFDDKIEPYRFLINVIIFRPAQTVLSYSGSTVDQTKFSYLSGYYVLTNIKNVINENGFSTTLTVTRWPTNFTTKPTPPLVKTQANSGGMNSPNNR